MCTAPKKVERYLGAVHLYARGTSKTRKVSPNWAQVKAFVDRKAPLSSLSADFK